MKPTACHPFIRHPLLRHQRHFHPSRGHLGTQASHQIPSRAPGSFLGARGRVLWLDGAELGRVFPTTPPSQASRVAVSGSEGQGWGRHSYWIPSGPWRESSWAGPFVLLTPYRWPLGT